MPKLVTSLNVGSRGFTVGWTVSRFIFLKFYFYQFTAADLKQMRITIMEQFDSSSNPYVAKENLIACSWTLFICAN